MALPISPAWAQIIEQYALHLRAADRSPNTVRARREQLAHMARRIGASPVEGDAAEPPAIRGLSRVANRNTSEPLRRDSREFFKWAKHEGWTVTNPAKRLPKVKGR